MNEDSNDTPKKLHPWEEYENNRHPWEKNGDTLRCDFCEQYLVSCQCTDGGA